MKSIIVTGGTGFIGSWFVKEIIKHEINIIALVRDKKKAKQLFGTKVRFIEYNSDEFFDLFSEKLDIDVFYHLAWDGVSTEKKNDKTIQLNNIKFSMDMLDYANSLGVKRFIATGTVAEYSYCEDVMDVNAKQTPNDLYGAAKTSTHYLLETWAKHINMPFNWVVIPSTYGEGRRDKNIITYTITSLLSGNVPLYGNLTQMWDFLYVGEVARALYLIGEKGLSKKTYAIGSGIYRPLREYMEMIRNQIDPSLELGIGAIPSLSENVFSSCVSIHELKADTGFVPKVFFEEGIKRTIDYFRDLSEF